MIKIEKPEVALKDDSVIISARFECEGIVDRLWYKLPIKYKEYLVVENLDAFVVGLLFLGLKTGNDIKSEVPISAKLHYNLNEYLIPALCLSSSNYKSIKIISKKLNYSNLNRGDVAGTGLSCGVDSFATFYKNLIEKESYRIQYFTFFNVGSHGDFGGYKAREIFHQRLKPVKEFAKKVGKEVIDIDSNLSELLRLNFQQSHSFRNLSCVLLLQKLFRNYFYASAYRFDYFKLNPEDTSDSDILNVNMLSTESTNLFSSVASLSRTERTILISNYNDTFEHLDVCTNPGDGEFKNCGVCDKCLRTALTLELVGKLKLYSSVFNLVNFRKRRDQYIGKLLVNRNQNPINSDVYSRLRESGKIQPKHYYYAEKFKMLERKKSLIKFIKSFI